MPARLFHRTRALKSKMPTIFEREKKGQMAFSFKLNDLGDFSPIFLPQYSSYFYKAQIAHLGKNP